jgi:hypothetical protein
MSVVLCLLMTQHVIHLRFSVSFPLPTCVFALFYIYLLLPVFCFYPKGILRNSVASNKIFGLKFRRTVAKQHSVFIPNSNLMQTTSTESVLHSIIILLCCFTSEPKIINKKDEHWRNEAD